MVRQDQDGRNVFEFDKIGHWSEIKLDILKKYAKPYSEILTKRHFEHYYIDAFAGAGRHKARISGELVPGSPLVVLEADPPFDHYFFIDKDEKKIGHLKEEVGSDANVTVRIGDCNRILLDEIFPRLAYTTRRRALCLLDPYGLHLDWEVVRAAGQTQTIEIFLNFPVADMNRNVLWRHDPVGPKKTQMERLTRYWGDESWHDVVYDTSGDLFGHPEKILGSNEAIVRAFNERLKHIAGFKYVAEPIPMRNTIGKTIYYLYFASPNKTGKKIVEDIFRKFRNMGSA